MALFLAVSLSGCFNNDGYQISDIDGIRNTPTSTSYYFESQVVVTTEAIENTSTPMSKTTSVPLATPLPLLEPGIVIAPENIEEIFPIAQFGWGKINKTSLSSDGLLLAVATSRGIVIFDSVNMVEKVFIPSWRGVQRTSFSKNNQYIAGFVDLKTINIWRLDDGAFIRSTTGDCAAFSPVDDLLAIGSSEGYIQLETALEGERPRFLEGHSETVSDITFSSDGKFLATASSKTIRIWDPVTGRLINEIQGLAPESILISLDGEFLTTMNTEARETLTADEVRNSYLLWEHPKDLSSAEFIKDFNHENNGLVFSPDNKYVSFGIDVWSIREGTKLNLSDELPERIRDVKFSVDGLTFLGLSADSIYIWQLPDGALINKYDLPILPKLFSILSPDTSQIVFGGESLYFIRINDKLTPKKIWAHRSVPFGSAFSSDGKLLAIAYADGYVKIWSTKSYDLVRSIRVDSNGKSTVAFSLDGKLIAAGEIFGNIKILREADGKLVHEMENVASRVMHLAFSVENQLLASLNEDQILTFWQVSDGSKLRELTVDISVADIEFSPDGTMFAIGYSDGAVEIWGVRENSY